MADKQTGLVRINGEPADELRYASVLESGRLRQLDVRFLNGSREVARVTLDRAAAIEALGLRNVQTIERNASQQSEGTREEVKGVLRGRSLENREVVLPRPSNAVEYATPARLNEAAKPQAVDADKKAAAVAGVAAMGVQAAGLGGADAQVAAAAVKGATFAAALATLLRRGNSEGREEQSQGEVADATAKHNQERGALQRVTDSTSVPPAVLQRYLKVGDRYYFPDRTLAFSDSGTKLKAETENKEVVRTLVAIARERAWDAIQVSGSDTFRREVWREASLAGLQTKGYSASQVDREAVEREIQRGASRKHAEGSQESSRTLDPAFHFEPLQIDPRQGTVTGKLVDHGAARFKHDPKEQRSYYVTLDTNAGRRTYWGVGLEDAIRKSATQPSLGDEVGVRQVGTRAVSVTVPVRDAEGRHIGEQRLDTHRNAWVLEKAESFKERNADRVPTSSGGESSRVGAEERSRAVEHEQARERAGQRSETARAFRNGQAAQEAIVREYPQLAAAIARVPVGEVFERKKWETPDERDRWVKFVRENLEQRIENGQRISGRWLRDTVERSANRTIDTVPKTPPEQRIARVKELPDRDQGLARV